MELRRLAVCLAFFVLAVSQCSEGHSVQRRETYNENDYNDLAADEAEEDTQNDPEDSEPEVTKPPAVIETVSQNYELSAGSDLRLECKVTPDAGSVVQWFRNNDALFIGSINLHKVDDRYSLVPNSKDLLIRNVKAADSGVFKCEVAQDQPMAVNHTLFVTEAPQVALMTATNGGIVSEGSALNITCQVTGAPVPTVVWSRKRTQDHGNTRLTEMDGEFSTDGYVHSLYVKEAKMEQSGEYYCYAFSKVGHHEASVMIVVKGKPRVHVPKTVVNSDLKIEAILQCSAHEEPSPTIRWYKDDVLIEESDSTYNVSTDGANSTLIVMPTADQHFGTFTCEATNEYGTHNRSIDLVQTPVIEDLEIDGLKMNWVVYSHQPLEAIEVQLRDVNGDNEWRVFNVSLPTVRHHRYEISYLLDDKQLQSGEYQAFVKVKNTKNWGSSADGAIFNLVMMNGYDQPQYIQHASVFRGNAAHSIRPEVVVLSTIIMSLLARML